MRLIPRSLVGQLMLATGLSLAVAQSVNFALLMHGRNEQRSVRIATMAANRIADVNERLAAGQPALPQRGMWKGRVKIFSVEPTERGGHDVPSVVEQLRKQLSEQGMPAERIRVVEAVVPMALEDMEARNRRSPQSNAIGKPVNTVSVSAQLVDGRWLQLKAPAPRVDPRLVWSLALQTLIIYLALLVPIWWIGRRAARPLRRLTDAARHESVGAAAERLPEEGPADVRDLTHAFNGLRERIVDMLREKDRMLGALGHDLRTPIASLRLRVEQVDNPGLRAKLIATLDEMATMIENILALARQRHERAPAPRTDLSALVEAVTEDYGDIGQAVRLGPIDRPVVRATQAVPVRRALRNLIDNAIKYGGEAEVSLHRIDGAAHIRVEDRGPGIAEGDIPAMLEPFARAETSRNRETGGTGLGLSLARALVDQEGGSLKLANRAGGGLTAEIILPLD